MAVRRRTSSTPGGHPPDSATLLLRVGSTGRLPQCLLRIINAATSPVTGTGQPLPDSQQRRAPERGQLRETRQDGPPHQLYPPALLVPAARGGSGQQRRRRRSGPPRGSTVEARAVVGYSYGDDDGTNLPDRRHAGTSLNSGETR
jgi:hypothetical protein